MTKFLPYGDPPVIFKDEIIRINPNTYDLEVSIVDGDWQLIETNLPKMNYSILKVYKDYIFILNEKSYIYAYSTDARHWEIIFEKSIFDENVKHPWKYVYILDGLYLLAIDDDYPFAYAYTSSFIASRFQYISKVLLDQILTDGDKLYQKKKDASVKKWKNMHKNRIQLKNKRR